MIVVTGAAGFIGSNLIRALNARGERDIIAVDNLTRSDKFRNLTDCEIADYVDKTEFLSMLPRLTGLRAVLHQGACSDTMESDGRYMMENNFRYSVALLRHCRAHAIPYLYASSASVYGGSRQFVEDRAQEKPLNVYGYSKFLFDQIVRRELPDAGSQVVGLRYFNVYGPGEAHKQRMASVAFHNFHQFRREGKVRLFEGWDGWPAGGQSRDFIFIDDVVAVNLHFLDHPETSGIFNCGTGRAQPFNDVAVAAVNAARALKGEPPLPLDALLKGGQIEYVPFPDALVGKYQSFTEADLSQLRSTGCRHTFADVATGVKAYVDWLAKQS